MKDVGFSAEGVGFRDFELRAKGFRFRV